MYWELELYNGLKMILLMLYWNDYKQTSKRTYKVNAFYLCILNDEKNFHIYSITYIPLKPDNPPNCFPSNHLARIPAFQPISSLESLLGGWSGRKGIYQWFVKLLK